MYLKGEGYLDCNQGSIQRAGFLKFCKKRGKKVKREVDLDEQVQNNENLYDIIFFIFFGVFFFFKKFFSGKALDILLFQKKRNREWKSAETN